MSSKSKSHSPPDDRADLTNAVQSLSELVELLTTAVENLVTEIQWQNNERSQNYLPPHLPLTKMPRDPAAKDWHPIFGRELVPDPPQPAVTPKAKTSRLFD